MRVASSPLALFAELRTSQAGLSRPSRRGASTSARVEYWGMGAPCIERATERRIAHARRLLVKQPELPVVDVAIACGYNNKNSFYNSFRRFVGMTPSEFRQKNIAPGAKPG